MPHADRASQFMPFSALKGFEEALREKEKIIVEKVELSEDALAFLDYQLNQLEVGSMVEIIYFEENEYLKKKGILSKINKAARCLTVVTTDISFDNIKEIHI